MYLSIIVFKIWLIHLFFFKMAFGKLTLTNYILVRIDKN